MSPVVNAVSADVVIFCGPTLGAALVSARLPEASVRGPAECGDILRATRAGVSAIGLIDGYFDHRLSVWHKEILWALSRGVRVYGSSSMGALRAAELASSGMVGVGAIFAAFASGALEDDDEVAVTHQAAEQGFRATSEALVNLRATLARAVECGALSAAASGTLIARMKHLFYPERSVPSLRAAAFEALPAAEAQALAQFIEVDGVVNQKLLDASALLDRITTDQRLGWHASSSRPAPAFPHTNAWQALLERCAEDPSAPRPRSMPSSPLESAPPRALAHEASPIERGAHAAARGTPAWELALEQAFALALARLHGIQVDAERAQREADHLRRQLGLLTPEATAAWLSESGLDVASFSRLVHDSLLTRDLEATMQHAVERQLPNALRLLDMPEAARRGSIS